MEYFDFLRRREFQICQNKSAVHFTGPNMAIPTSATSPPLPANPGRVRLLVWPREHGAWGILLIPLITGAAAGSREGHNIISLALFVVSALAMFCLRTPVETLLELTPWRAQTELEKRAVYVMLGLDTSVAALSLGLLLIWRGAYLLLALGAAVFVIFLAQAAVKTLGRENRWASQLVGSLGLTSTAAGAFYVVTGRLSADAFLFWGLNWLFAANQIMYVQMRIGASRATNRMEKFRLGRAFLNGEGLTALLLLGAWLRGILPAALVLAFLPVAYRGTIWFFQKPAPLRIHRLGLSELGHAILFGVLLIAALFLAPK